jgi:hypothetical protein
LDLLQYDTSPTDTPKPQSPPVPLPTLTTRETARLRDNYPSIEHLEAGNVASWLVERQDQLLCRAGRGRAEMNVAKLVTMAGTAIGAICYATSPLAPLWALLAGVGYVWAVGQDLNDSHQFAPIPFVRGNFFEFLAAMGDSEARTEWFAQKNELADLIFHLDLYERYEFVMLREFNSHLSAYLDQVETGKRFYAYRWLLDRYIDYKGALPDQQSLQQHLASVALDPRVNYQTVGALMAQQVQLVPPCPEPRTISLAAPPTVALTPPTTLEPTGESLEITREPLETTGAISPVPSLPKDEEKPGAPVPRNLSTFQNPEVARMGHNPPTVYPVAATGAISPVPSPRLDRDALRTLPLDQRAERVIALLHQAGFDLAKCVDRQITAICGNQRGGKGTLMAILAILSCALSPALRVHYFTAGTDVYPFRCDRLICATSFPGQEEPDKAVAAALYRYLREMDKASVGAYADRILVIDEAVALSDSLEAEQKQWMIRFLLSRASKKGCQIFIVLHGNNLTSWVGTGNTSGLSSTFKADVTFIGCEATSKKVGALRSIALATGTYFLADPENFATPVKGGDIGTIPGWLKTEINPFTGQPDPARTLLTLFPELQDDHHAAPVTVPPPDSLSAHERQELEDAITKVASTKPLETPAEKPLTPQTREIYTYIRERGGEMEALTIAKNKGLPIATVRDLLRQLIVSEKGEPWGSDGIRLL